MRLQAPASFCDKDSLGQLVVIIRNQGLLDAPDSSITKVEFIPQTISVVKYTPAIPVGGNVELTFEIPPQAYDPDCNFIITIDPGNRIKESNEGNNRIDGISGSGKTNQ